MSEAKFTKGPWQVIPQDGIVYDNNGEMVCGYYPTGEIEEEANASLIAAAPDMYEMLTSILSTQKRRYGYAMELHIDMINLAEEVNKLLAKARGEQL
jgi:hypothetical protein